MISFSCPPNPTTMKTEIVANSNLSQVLDNRLKSTAVAEDFRPLEGIKVW